MTSTKKPMNIENALNRINWRFTNPNIKLNESKIVINENDVEAVNFLTNWITQQKSETLQENQLFAKLYCYCLTHEIEFYKDIKFANRKLQEELAKPINHHYANVSETLNRMELNYFLNSIGIVTDHMKSCLMNEIQQQEQQELLNNNQKEITKYVLGIWNIDKVFKSLNNTITECLNKFKNK